MSDPSYCANTQMVDIVREIFSTPQNARASRGKRDPILLEIPRTAGVDAPSGKSSELTLPTSTPIVMIRSLSCGRPVHWTSLGVAGVVAFSVTPSGEVEALSVI